MTRPTADGLWEGTYGMNFVISAIVGCLCASAVSVGAVQAIQGSDQKPVSNEQLFEYSDD